MYLIIKNTYFCRNILQIFLYFIHNVKKLCFDVHFYYITSKALPWLHSTTPPPPWLGFTAVLDHPKVGERQLTMACSPVQCRLGFRSVYVPLPYRVQGWRVLIWAHSLARSKWTADAISLGKFPKP
jgi:hypothetical protein